MVPLEQTAALVWSVQIEREVGSSSNPSQMAHPVHKSCVSEAACRAAAVRMPTGSESQSNSAR